MTESVHAVKPRVGSHETPIEADAEPAAPCCQVPVAGLVFGASLEGPGQLGGPIARPGSVVAALRRQAIRGQTIRRSSGGVVMNLDEPTDQEEETVDELAPWAGTLKEAGKNIVEWLRAKEENATNYTVAVCGGRIYISKVNGVTWRAGLMKQLKGHIRVRGINQVCSIYLCHTYSSLSSNHAEMCVVAAIGSANIGNITFLECTAASCDYCRIFLECHNVPNSSPANDPAVQKGWSHPFQPFFWGSQVSNDKKAQLADLRDCLVHKTNPKIGKSYPDRPPAGRCTFWL